MVKFLFRGSTLQGGLLFDPPVIGIGRKHRWIQLLRLSVASHNYGEEAGDGEHRKSAPTCEMFTSYFKHLHDMGSGKNGGFFSVVPTPPTHPRKHHGFFMTHHVFSLTRSSIFSIFSISTLSNFE